MADEKESAKEIAVNREQGKPFKVINKARTRKVGVVACNFDELKFKCREKFNIEEDVSFVIDSDGTEVDSDYLDIVQSDTLMILQGDENWEGPVSYPASSQCSDEKVMKLIQELKESKKRKKDGKQSKKGKDVRLISVQVGWLNYSYKDERYRLVKATRERPDSGPRLMKLDTNSTFESIERCLRLHYFPGRKSPMGHEKKYKFSVGTYNGQEIEKSLTLGEYSSSHPKPRVYLLSKQTPLAILTDSSSDSDFEIPKITINKRHASATATASEPTAMDLNDTLDASTLLFSTTAPFQVDDITDTSNSHRPSSHSDVVTPTQFVNTSASSTQSQTSPNYQSLDTPTSLMDPVVPSARVQMPLTATFSSVEMTSSPDRSDTSNSLVISPPVTSFVMAGTPTVEMKIDKKCIICYERPPTAFYFPCGHTSCLPCALHIEANGGKCPHCRGQITKVRSIFNDFDE